MDAVVRDADDFFVVALLVLHLQHADRAGAHHGAGDHRGGNQDQGIGRVAVLGHRSGNKTVGGRIGGGREQEAVDEHRPRCLVHFVFHRGTLRDLDHHVDVVRRVAPGRDFCHVHVGLLSTPPTRRWPRLGIPKRRSRENSGGSFRSPQAVMRSRFGVGMARPSRFASSIQHSIASETLCAASSRVSPSDMQPGRSGTSATKPPPSSGGRGSITIR